jgi:hypothetical protein
MKFFEFDTTTLRRWELVNYDRLLSEEGGLQSREFKKLWPDGLFAVTRGPWTIPEYLEQPHIVIPKKHASTIADINVIDGFMFISTKFKALIEEIAPGSCDFRPCRTEYSDGSPAPEIWHGSVVRVFNDVVDLEKSRVFKMGTGAFSFCGEGRFAYFSAKLKDAVLFRVAQSPGRLICGENFKMAVKSAGIKGVRFDLCGELSEQ